LQAVEKNPCKENIDVLVKGGIDHALVRNDAIYLFQKISKVDWLCTGDDDRKRIPFESEEKIRNWWKENREKFDH